MPSVSVETSLTLRVGNPTFGQYAKISLRIDNIETSLPLEPQLQEAQNVLPEVFKVVMLNLDKNFDSLEKDYTLKITEKK